MTQPAPPPEPTPAQPPEASLAPTGPARSRKVGDLPEDFARRYLTAPEPGGLGFYVDHLTKTPAFRDQGKRLLAARADPHALRDMARIARHRGWAQVVIAGAPAFRREAWLALRLQGLETRGYRPTSRDLQVLERRLETRRPEPTNSKTPPPAPTQDLAARSHLAVAQTVLTATIVDPALREEALAAARRRIAYWLERGASFTTARVKPDTRDKDRSR